MPIELLRPVGFAEFAHDVSAAVDPNTLVDDDPTPDEDTTYIYSSATKYTSFTFNTGLAGATVITRVDIYIRAKVVADAGAGDQVNTFATFDQATYTSPAVGAQLVTTAYIDYIFPDCSRPGGGGWTAADFEATEIEIGVESRQSGASEVRITQMWILLHYAPALMDVIGGGTIPYVRA